MGFGRSGNSEAVAEQRRAADEARVKEEERRTRLLAGTQAINRAFDGGWQDSFFGNYRKAHEDVYLPEVEDKFNTAKDQLTFDLARSGLLRSTAAADAQADLLRQRADNEAAVRADADTRILALREQVNSDRQKAVNQLYATENPEIGANAALDSVRTIQSSSPGYSPLGDIFSVATKAVQNYQQGRNDRRFYDIVTAGTPKSNASRTVY